MASLVKELIDAGIHFGHRATNWNPKMKPFIFGKRNKIHIIDIKATIKGLLLARKFLSKIVAEGHDVLFVGTKRQAKGIIEQYVKPLGMPYVTERWLGGTLTNFRTIRERLKRLEELEQLEASGEISKYSKKMESALRREKAKILRNLEGIRNMTKLPGALVVIDVNHEINAVREAKKLGIPTVCLIDTDGDPDYADIPIPGNDDAMRAIEVVVESLAAAVAEGKQLRSITAAQAERVQEGSAAAVPVAEAAGGGEGTPGASAVTAVRARRVRVRSERSASARAEAVPAEGASEAGVSAEAGTALPVGESEKPAEPAGGQET